MLSFVNRLFIGMALACLIITHLNGQLYAQSVPETVTYNFKTKVVTDTQPVNHGEYSCLKITNINRFVYDIHVTTALKKFSSSPPKELSLIVQSAKQSETSPSKLETVARSTGINLHDTTTLRVSTPVSAALTALGNVRLKQQRLATAYTFHHMISDYSIVASDAADADLRIRKLRPEFLQNSSWEKEYENYLLAVEEFLKLVPAAEAAVLEKGKEPTAQSSLEAIRNVVTEECTAIQNSFPKLLRSIQHLTTLMTSDDMYQYLCPPVQAERDYIQYTVAIKPRVNDLATAVTTEDPINFKQQIYGSFRFSFSTGFASAFRITNKRYRLEPSGFFENDSAFIREEPVTNFSPMLTFNVNTAYQTGQWYRIGMMFGVGYRVGEDTKLTDAAFLLGLTFHIGAVFAGDDEIIIGAGGLYAPVQQLRGQYAKDQLVRHHPEIDGKLLESRYKTGIFVSLSYNLTGKAE